MKPQRAKGVVTYRSPVNPNILAAEELAKQKEEQRRERAAARAAAPVPNYICYPAAFKDYDPKTGRWKGGPSRLPTCHVCGGNLPPMENHVCAGFTPKYVERTEETKQRWEAKREEIRESRQRKLHPTCSVCGEEIEDFEMGQWHWDSHEGVPERVHQAVDGEPDGDLDGYEDEPEEDYCEGDDDGYDCD